MYGNTMESGVWKTIVSSVKGASHIRVGLPNQDSVNIQQNIPNKLPIIIAVADGHGSKRSFRSERGSNYAIKVAINTLNEFILNTQNLENFSSIKRIAEEQLPQEIVKRWRLVIEHDLDENPLSEHENEQVTDSNEIIAYGTTLLVAVITNSFLMFLQIGDGDILILTEKNSVERPIPRDKRLLANETTSLCSENAWRDFFCSFIPLTDNIPSLIMLSTDGYSNSFVQEEDFEKVVSDIHELINNKGIAYVQEQLEGWLNESSEKGSGDDITVGIATYLLNKSE